MTIMNSNEVWRHEKLKFFGNFFVNDRREKVDGRIGGIDAKKFRKDG